MYYTVFWLILMIICIVIEAATLALTSVWFVFGAIAAFIAALFGAPLPVQIALFLGVSIVTLIITRPIAVKWLNKDTVKTNYQEVIGKKARVTQRVDNLSGTGTAVIDGLEWTARSSSDEVTYEAGEIAEVADIKGVKVILNKSREV